MSIDAQYFADLYAANEDPWAFRTRWYEKRKRDLVMASLPRQCYERVFEPACANGELSVLLAERCAELVCQDLDPKAVGLATDRLADVRHAQVERARLPADWPGGRFDLIVLSEVGYYLDPTDWLQVIEQSVASLSYDGGLLACHWKHPIAGCPQDGREVHRMLSKHLPLYPVFCHDEADFIMAYWSNQPSVVDLDETCI
ncbi:methyltransferase domain-containing protein [Pseudomonas putida]|uniref:class I SAM-dependent methyltransferase n=1 Tax=Pseudomonas TaxID=286 RepID=UPI0011A53F0A|nr:MULTISPECIES: SAM-dependent methyltransferase [Pseudomonas]MBF8636515.1 methyltransferase domain-containing protein [Pseudomonas fulva]MBF8651010.1 methyltransferase domain-containing protein [Pseudomonas putida]MBF8655776.1 methyltransferase domain-containing protein [Pseudomonas putida]MBF8689670.1 methyltransferase domain-containing protein [Pseudomonas fulva]MBF8765855.1 methyltransferase domain-containing protein [Pseudomonas putida]